MITVEQTETVTSFRNGEVNLHSLHVKQKKGRTCRDINRRSLYPRVS
jgi:hypothetical protein